MIKYLKKTLFFATVILFFIIIYKSFYPALPNKKNRLMLYADQTRDDIKQIFLSSFKKAKKSIDIIIFGIRDKKILETLDKKDIDIAIHYDKRFSKNLKNANPIKSKGLMHQKIIIIDKKLIFLGSCNLTQSSLHMDHNLVMGIYNKNIASFLKKNAFINSSYQKENIQNQNIEIFILPDKEKKALKKILDLIRSSKKSIKIAIFTFTHPLIKDEIIKAKKRNVKIEIIVDRHLAYGPSAKTIESLKKNEITVLKSQGIELLHHKYIFIDDKILIGGSCNFTKAAFSKNNEILFILYPLKKNQKRFMNKLHKIIYLEGKEL